MSVNMETFQQFASGVQQLKDMAPKTEIAPDERVARAKRAIIQDLDARMATDLETCVHCGMCAEACHFYVTTQDAKYTPIHKLDLIRKVYRRDIGPNRWFHRLLTRDITTEDLERWQELCYDSCTECGRCSLICPMGIHIAAMVGVMRGSLTAAGLDAPEQRAVSLEQEHSGTVFGIGRDQLLGLIEQLRSEGLEVAVDRPDSEILVLTSVLDISLFLDAMRATIKILNQTGRSWSICTAGFEAANMGYMSGNHEAQRAATLRVINAAIECRTQIVLVPECGHSYPALRWDGADVYGAPLPFEVMAISEFVGQEIEAGRVRVKPIGKDKKVTYHDPCKVGRVGGVFQQPRAALKALDVDLRELRPNRTQNWCCGGGAAVFLINRAAPLRQKVFELKAKQVEETGADTLVTACGSCRVNFLAGANQVHWTKNIESLIELVSANLEE